MENITALKTLIFHDLKQQLKNKLLHTVFIFAAVIIYVSFLASTLAGEQQARAVSNFGFAIIELTAIAAVVFSLSSVILKDIETKTIYLVLSRPVKRWVYITAKYAAVVLSIAISVFLMGIVLIGLMFIKKIPVDLKFLQILLAVCLKVSITGAAAMVFSLVSTSVLSCIIMTGIFYTLGHFMAEIKFISKNLPLTSKILTIPLKYIIPNMAVFNLNDILNSPDAFYFPGWHFITGYAFVYCLVCVLISVFLFRKREF